MKKSKLILYSLIICIVTFAGITGIMIHSYTEMHYDKKSEAYILSESMFEKFVKFSDKTFAHYEENGYKSSTTSDWFVLSEAKICLDEYMSSNTSLEKSCIEWATETGRGRYGVQYSWKTSDGLYYSKVFSCKYDEGTYPKLKFVQNGLVQVSTTSIVPG